MLMTFFQFALNNVRRNGRAYAAYFLSSAFAILMFFLYATLANHPDLHQGYVSRFATQGMQVAEYIIFGFSFFSILYSMGSFLRRRSHEFGILTILGTSNWQLTWLIFLENMLLGITAIIASMIVGLITAKLFLMLGSVILDIPPLPFYWPSEALLTTCVAFFVLFFLISLATTFFMRKKTVLTLLTGSRQPKQEPRASVWLALLAAALLITGYIMAATYDYATDERVWQPIIVIILIAIGTYLLYSQLSVFIIYVIKKRRNYYWRGTHMLWLSELTYNMKDNARLFFAVAMLLSVAFTATGALAVFKAPSSISLPPFAFTLVRDQSGPKALQSAQTVLDQSLASAHLSYTAIQVPFIIQTDSENNRMRVMLISQTSYNHLATFIQFQPLTVQPGEAIAFPYQQDSNTVVNKPPATIPDRQSKGQLHVMPSKVPGVLDKDLYFHVNNLFIITDQDYQNQSMHHQQGLYVLYIMSQWKATTTLSANLMPRMGEIEASASDDLGLHFIFSSRAYDYFITYQLPNITLFIGLFTAIIFLTASGSFLYFRLYTTLNENRERYKALSKIGLTETEMSASMTIQVIILFFAPFLMAVLNTVFFAIVIKNNLHTDAHVFVPMVATTGFFLALQAIYFFVVRAQHLSQLKQALI
jgi:putative ABC transport system permease protein